MIVGWAGMRGVVSLAIAFSIPLTTADDEPFPARNLVLFLTFTTVIGTLVVQGLTLPALIRLLKLPGRDRKPRRSPRPRPRTRRPRSPTNGSRSC